MYNKPCVKKKYIIIIMIQWALRCLENFRVICIGYFHAKRCMYIMKCMHYLVLLMEWEKMWTYSLLTLQNANLKKITDYANFSDNQEVLSNPPWLFGDILDFVVKRGLPHCGMGWRFMASIQVHKDYVYDLLIVQFSAILFNIH